MFELIVRDNFRYQDETEHCTYGTFATWQEAVAVARAIVDSFLADEYRPGMTADSLYEQYVTFGEDPFISPQPPDTDFSAWDYAKGRCDEICEAGGPQTK